MDILAEKKRCCGSVTLLRLTSRALMTSHAQLRTRCSCFFMFGFFVGLLFLITASRSLQADILLGLDGIVSLISFCKKKTKNEAAIQIR